MRRGFLFLSIVFVANRIFNSSGDVQIYIHQRGLLDELITNSTMKEDREVPQNEMETEPEQIQEAKERWTSKQKFPSAKLDQPTDQISVDTSLHQLTKDEKINDQTRDEYIPPFIQENCDLSGVDYWMVPEDDWRRQIKFLIMGEKKSGTTGLFQTLNSHSQVIPGKRKELIFFNPKKFRHWEDDRIGGRVKVARARKALFKMFSPERLQENKTLITGEGTPEYLLYPDICDKAILCTIPWVKMIVIIREPIERLFSHYNFLKDPTKHNARLAPFETFVERDIDGLQRIGILPQNLTWSQIERHMGSEAERDAYIQYQNQQGERQFLRSLYALQLEGWERSLKKVGKDPMKDMKVVISSEVKSDPNVTRDLLDWLGLQPQPHEIRKAMVTKYTSLPIDPQFKEKLDSIIAPYNKRLYKFLGDRYNGIFDKN